MAILKKSKKLKNVSGLVFLDDNGQPIEPRRITQAVKRAYVKVHAKKLGRKVSKLTPQEKRDALPTGGPVKIFRHTFGSRLYRKTRDLLLVQQAMGHADVSQTQKYAHVCNEDRRQGVRAMAKATSEAMEAISQGDAA